MTTLILIVINYIIVGVNFYLNIRIDIKYLIRKGIDPEINNHNLIILGLSDIVINIVLIIALILVTIFSSTESLWDGFMSILTLTYITSIIKLFLQKKC